MGKSEWREEHEREIRDYGKSMISHFSDEESDPMKDYEWSIMHHDDDYGYDYDDDGGIHHFQD